jgi:murein DD-endopeptidase MepM/ murein hydrolase activator NlpD
LTDPTKLDAVDLYRPTVLPIDPFGTPDVGFRSFRVTSPYGTRKDPLGQSPTVFHGGLDLGNGRLGDEIIAAGAGKIIVATREPRPPWNWPSPPDKVDEWGPSYGGLTVVIEHSRNLYTLHAHLRDRDVEEGERVDTEQLLGHVGESGSAVNAGHLHYGVRDLRKINNGHNGWVDPWPLIQPRGPWEDPAVIAELRAQLARCRGRADALRDTVDEQEEDLAKLEALVAADAADDAAMAATIRKLRTANKILRTKLAEGE